MKARPSPATLAGLAATTEAATVALVAILWRAAFADGARLSEATSVRASYVVMLLGAGIALALVLAAAYRAIGLLRPIAAITFSAGVCFPLVLVAVGILYGALACLAMM